MSSRMTNHETSTHPSPAIPRCGDVFAFRGLGADDLDGRTMRVTGISVTGGLQFSIAFLGEEARPLHSAPLSDVLAMIGAGIWVPVPQPAEQA